MQLDEIVACMGQNLRKIDPSEIDGKPFTEATHSFLLQVGLPLEEPHMWNWAIYFNIEDRFAELEFQAKRYLKIAEGEGKTLIGIDILSDQIYAFGPIDEDGDKPTYINSNIHCLMTYLCLLKRMIEATKENDDVSKKALLECKTAMLQVDPEAIDYGDYRWWNSLIQELETEVGL
jgi:hypothetical protein